MVLYTSIWGFAVKFAANLLLDAHDQSPHHNEDSSGLFPPYIGRNLGQYSPFFPVEPYVPGPLECEITQVNLLYRHAARDPTADSGEEIQATLKKLKAASHLSPNLAFLKDYKWNFTIAELVPFGAKESFAAGKSDFERYQSLLPGSNRSVIRPEPFLRASLSQRVIDTATNWTAGFTKTSHTGLKIPEPLLIPEDPSSNNTLHNKNCPSLNETISEESQQAFLSHFAPPITARLNLEAPGADLVDLDIVQLYFLCAYDSMKTELLSPFCRLFTPEEYVSLEYYQDLGKYYLTGYGNPLGPVQGVGYVNEIVARLTSQPVANVTNINRTLDANPETFPLSRTIYADFAHDDQMLPIYAALNIHKPPTHLPTDKLASPGSPWVASKLVPFAARLVVEKYTCVEPDAEPTTGKKGNGDGWVRIVHNDRVIEVPGCANARAGGLCELNAFIDTLDYAVGGAAEDWAKCVDDSN